MRSMKFAFATLDEDDKLGLRIAPRKTRKRAVQLSSWYIALEDVTINIHDNGTVEVTGKRIKTMRNDYYGENPLTVEQIKNMKGEFVIDENLIQTEKPTIKEWFNGIRKGSYLGNYIEYANTVPFERIYSKFVIVLH